MSEQERKEYLLAIAQWLDDGGPDIPEEDESPKSQPETEREE